MLILTLLLGCKPDDTAPTPVEDIESAATEWLTNLAAAPVADIGTTLDVSFDTPVSGPAWVAYRIDGGEWQQTPATEPGTTHRLPVIGAPYAEVTLKAVAELDGVLRESGEVLIEAGGPPPEAPVITVTVDGYTPPEEDALLLLGVFGDLSYAVMMDFDGTMRWSHPLNDIGEEARGGLGVVQSVVPGQLLVNVFMPGEPYNDSAELRRINLLGEVTFQSDTPGGHHFFAETPDGAVLWLRYDARTIGSTTVIGDELMRLPPEGGSSESVVNLWDLLPPPTPPKGAARWDWTHANWLLYSPERDRYLLSTAKTNLLMELGEDGTLHQIINGHQAPTAPYQYDDESQAFGYPHGIHWDASGQSLLVLQRRDQISTAARYRINEDSLQIERTWNYGADLEYDSTVLGEVQELSDGNFLVSWGGLGILQVVSPQQEVLWEAQTGLGTFFSHMHVITDPYNAP
jgi:hypothetical protein